MKRIVFWVVAALVMTVAAQAREPSRTIDQKRVEKAFEMYKRALQSENLGVRKSSIYFLAKMKSLNPEVDFKPVIKQIGKMSRNDKEPVIRVQAGLALAYFKDPILQEKIEPKDPNDSTEFFNQLYTQLASQ